MRPVSVKGVFVASLVALGGLALAVALVLAVLNARYDHLSLIGERETNSVRSISELRFNALVYSREMLLLATTDDQAHRREADQARAMVWSWLEVGRTNLVDDQDTKGLEQIEASLQTYFDRREALLVQGIRPSKQMAASSAEFNKVLDQTNEYLTSSRAEVGITTEHLRVLSKSQTVISFAVVVIFPFAMILLLLAARKTVFIPFRSLLASLIDYSAGDLDARAPEDGPSELREMARSFNDLADSLAQQHRNRYEFLLAVAHDLRNPLTALKGTVDLAKRRLEHQGAWQEILEKEHRRVRLLVNRLNRIVSDLVDMSRVEAGRFDLQLTSYDVRALALEVEELFEDASPHHSLVVDLPSSPVMVCCDPTRMGQVLNNLVSNAIKYSPEGGEVLVRVGSARGHAILEVRDQGIGISADELRQIFQPFHRVDPEAVPGVGLGLSVAKRLVEAQGGVIGVESRPGAGSTFRILLPLEQPPSEARERPPA